MLPIDTLKFLKSLQNNNNKIWMDEHRTEYENTRNNFSEFVTKLITRISKFDSTVIDLLAKDCTFRINRDIRFAKDKRPYKNNFAAYINKGGKKGEGAGYYVHIEPGKSFIAAGIWMPEPATLAKIRQEIDYNLKEWNQILNSAGFKKNFINGIDHNDVLIRPPKGYTDDNPAIEFLKMKSFIARQSFTDKEITDKKFLENISKSFQAIKMMIHFINRSLD